MATVRRAVDLVRTLRSAAGIKVRQPLARLWLALPGGDLPERAALLELLADEVNVKAIELIGDESALVERRVKPLLPVIGRKYGDRIPAIMAAARSGAFEITADGGVDLAGLHLAPDEVEILAAPLPGTAVAHDEGLVVVIDTQLTPALLAEGDARELQRAIQDLRREAELDLDARIEVWVDPLPGELAAYLEAVRGDTLADRLASGPDSGRPAACPGRARRAGRSRSPCVPRPGAASLLAEEKPPVVTAVIARPRPAWLLFGGLAAIVLVLDQLSKAWIVANVAPGQVVDVVGSWVRLIFSRNDGALFGLFGSSATLFAVGSLAVLGLIIWYHGRSPRSILLSIALGLLLGGALGNLIDRVRLGYVVDFVDMGVGTLRFFTFNVGDSAISTAILLLLILALRPAPKPAAVDA